MNDIEQPNRATDEEIEEKLRIELQKDIYSE